MNSKQTYIRSTKVNLSKANKLKLNKLLEVQTEYSKIVTEFVDMLWNNKEEHIPSLKKLFQWNLMKGLLRLL